jgi:hypothetical protein
VVRWRLDARGNLLPGHTARIDELPQFEAYFSDVSCCWETAMAKKRFKRREWTKDDIRQLKALARQKMTARKIAQSLKRTEAATKQKASSLEISLNSRV